MTDADTRAIKRDAREHHLFGMVPREVVQQDGTVIFTRGEGITLVDVDGHEYLDMMGTLTRANSLGYGQEEIARAVYNQMVNLHYVGTIWQVAEPTIQLAAKIASLAPGQLSTTFFVSGGSEAVETAFKLAKQYHYFRKQKPRAFKIISRETAYHGRTMGALGAFDFPGARRDLMEPGVPGHTRIPATTCYRCPFNLEYPSCDLTCARWLEREIQKEDPEFVAAFIAEPLMQANGVQVPPPEYFPLVREICSKYEVLFIADEVITGFGRTGEWFALNHWDVEPDIMTVAKAIAAGYFPLGAAITREEIAAELPTFLHAHTFSGHAAGAAAALATIAIYERDNLVARAKEMGTYLLDALKPLERHPIVGQVRGLGMWLAIDFTADKRTKAPFTDDTVKAVELRTRELGVLVSANGTAIEMAPPLVARREELDRLATTLEQAIHDVSRARGLG